jgi:hypothetical protein
VQLAGDLGACVAERDQPQHLDLVSAQLVLGERALQRPQAGDDA